MLEECPGTLRHKISMALREDVWVLWAFAGTLTRRCTLLVSADRKITSTERDFGLTFIRLAHSTSHLRPQILVRNRFYYV